VVDADRPLDGKVLALIFDKHSTRTRISFDVAMRQLGGTTLMMSGKDMQLAREETIADTARVLSRYVDAVMIRLLDHEMVQELADNATIPVINGLTKLSHPCQVMAAATPTMCWRAGCMPRRASGSNSGSQVHENFPRVNRCANGRWRKPPTCISARIRSRPSQTPTA
jgi:hypothetical protein